VRRPLRSAREFPFDKTGQELHHQTGGHIILRRTFPPHRHLPVPGHREVARGTLRAIIRNVGLTVEEFLELLD
jgi:predicted RNA binding protein YcfA (HicA-like mRNA interferase family)